MSQSGTLKVNTGGNATVEFLTANTGGAVGPDASHNINIIGNNTSGINIIGTPGSNTLTVVATQSTTSQQGAVTLATNAQAIAGSDTNNAITSAALGAKLGTQTAHSLAVFEGTSSALTALGVATNGQLPIGSTGVDPVLATLTAGTGITITNAAGSITIATSSTAVVDTLTGNTGGAISPTGGNINTIGTGSITIAGSGSTLTTQLTGLTNHAIQIGAGTATLTQLGAGTTGQILQTNTAADPTWSTATYPSTATGTGTILRADGTNWVATTATYPATTTINQILYSSSANVVGGLSTANNGVLTTGTSGIPAIIALGTDGQVIIGSSAGAPAAATITAGSGISVTNGHNTITIAATGAGFVWNNVSGTSATMAAENGYIANNAGLVTLTMPANNAIGDTIKIVGKGAGGWKIVYTTNQNIIIGNSTSTTTTGNLSSTNANDCVELVCTTASASAPIFTVVSSIGNISIT